MNSARILAYLIILSLWLALGGVMKKIPHVQAATKTTVIGIETDAYVESGFPNTITYNQQNLFIGYDRIYSKGVTRTYIKPRYADLVSKNISSDIIVKATLRFYVYYNNQSSIRVRVYKVTSPWDELSLTYNNQPSVQYYNYKDISGTGWKEFSITSLIKDGLVDFIQNGRNLGLMLRYANEQLPALRIKSVENGDTALVPHIIIEYKDNTVPTSPQLVAPADGMRTNQDPVVFQYQQSTDPDGDPLTYRLEISTDAAFNTYFYKSTYSAYTGMFTKSLSDGTYWWRIRVKDSYNTTQISVARKLIVDRTPPTLPQLLAEPPVTGGSANTINWLDTSGEPGVMFQAQSSPTRGFKPNETLTSPWITNTQYTFTNLEDRRYYYRVRAKDDLGNISPWTAPVWSVQDSKAPTFDYIKLSKKFVNPRWDPIFVRVKSIEPHIKYTGVVVKNKQGKVLLEYNRDSENYLSWQIPVQSLADGFYYVYGVAQDILGHKSYSDTRWFVLDRHAPAIYLPDWLRSPIVYKNKHDLTLNIKCVDKLHLAPKPLNIYINNRLVYSGPNVNYKLSLKDRTYTIKLKCTDAAGNYVQLTRRLVIDTKPPVGRKLQINRYANNLSIKTRCSADEFLHITLGSTTKKLECRNGQFNAVFENIAPDLEYTLVYFFSDLAGNRSETYVATIEKFRDKLDTPARYIINCSTTVNIHKGTAQAFVCKKSELPRVLQVKQKQYKHLGGENTYAIEILTNYPARAPILVDIFGCKAVSPLDLRTFFKCVNVELHKTIADAPIEYQLSLRTLDGRVVSLESASIRQIATKAGLKFMLKMPKHITAGKYKLEIHGFIRGVQLDLKNLAGYGPTAILDIEAPIIGNIHDVIIPRPVVYDMSKIKPLQWFFKDYNAPVTQWFGKTCYNPWHHGIDFAVYKKVFLAPADGVIDSQGFHKGTKCRSGGRWLAVAHKKLNLYSYFWHIERSFVKTGAFVKKGQPLGITGNTGRYACRKLPYHLHFEVRTQRAHSSAINPVTVLNVDWKKLGVKYPYNKCSYSGQSPLEAP